VLGKALNKRRVFSQVLPRHRPRPAYARAATQQAAANRRRCRQPHRRFRRHRRRQRRTRLARWRVIRRIPARWTIRSAAACSSGALPARLRAAIAATDRRRSAARWVRERELRRLLTNVVDLTSIDYYVVCCCDYHQPADSALPLLYCPLISDWS
jgi:hypothetical protein